MAPTSDQKQTQASPTAATTDKKPKAASLEDDDEFEDFPAARGLEPINLEKAEAAERELNAWEDAWEDDDEAEDFAVLLQLSLPQT
ncbi:hypothetical protein HDU82_000939 [Entophlyctis luteolus]|nr:hypothetical protein HDU82_000930 [Entophlyctis luteolus]KAJ3212517.1 hypothetical protein HDU82_000939 [Entophlyctis luteolus]KAJ3382216.1 hypothetical protein HDU84_004419 [Entophlyctis sp. JEL0112]